MKNSVRIAQVLFGIPWFVFGLQHFLYGEFVASLVPGFMPFKLFWAYMTGAAMIAAGISFIGNRLVRLAATFLGLMLMLFVLMIHIPALLAKTLTVAALTRPVQDVALACSAFLLAKICSSGQGNEFKLPAQITILARYLFAAALVGFGIQQFFDLDFLTAKIPVYFPFRIFWVYLLGIGFITAGLSVFSNYKTYYVLTILGITVLFVNLLNHSVLMATDVHQPLLWTAAMLDLAITAGIFILAFSSRNSVRLESESIE